MISHLIRQPGCNQSLVHYRRMPDPRLPDIRARLGYFRATTLHAQIAIEQFVSLVVGNERPAVAYFSRGDSRLPCMTPMGEHQVSAIMCLGFFDSERPYPAKLYAFLEACWCLEDFCGIDYLALATEPQLAVRQYPDEMNGLADKIRMSARQSWFDELNVSRAMLS